MKEVIADLEGILMSKSTTYLRTVFVRYCAKQGIISKWNHKCIPEKWFFAQYDCKRRLRAECRLNDGEHELTIVMRKKAGFYLLIEYDRIRIFECNPKIIVLDEGQLRAVVDRYKALFDELARGVVRPSLSQ